MRNGKDTTMRRRGFTIIELLVVISIMAVLATLVTGAAMKAMKQSRVKRILATCKGLEVALMNYRAQENKWPCKLNTQNNATTVWYHGEDNKEVFKDMYYGGAGSSTTAYLEGSSLMAYYNGSRTTLNKALGMGRSDVALMYPNPDEPSRVNFYCVEFNLITDSAKVHVQHDKRGDHNCPKYDYDNMKQR
jgi:prepilin-type N-terminal cleavage/methylation domain-containing protein